MAAKKTKKVGRPSVLTPEITETIANALKSGAYIETAVIFAGIHKATFFRWMQRGARERSGPLHSFCDAIKKAMAFAELRLLALVRAAAESGVDSSWTAAAWMLERRWPAKYRRRWMSWESHPTSARPAGMRSVLASDRAGA
jgi:hypothetical protein